MTHSSLAKWLKLIILVVAICGFTIYIWLIPDLAKFFIEQYPDYQNYYYPWLIFIWISGIPCYTGMILSWKISNNIGNDSSFTLENGKLLNMISKLFFCDSGFVFIMNIIYFLAGMSQSGIFLISVLIVFIGIAGAVISSALATLVNQAAELQEQSDGTI